LIRVLHDHDDGDAQAILRGAFAALPPGGTLLIAEPMSGQKGAEACARQVAEAANLMGCEPAQVFAASTGVIGVPLPQDKAIAGVRAAHAALGQASWLDVTRAIGTTDTFPKAAAREAMIGGTRVRLVGFIKGSGMIAPDMATMLGFLVTDAAVSAQLLRVSESADWLEWSDWAAPVLADPIRVKDGFAEVPSRPGSGIEWDEAGIEKYAL
jgi:hypothetical protein